MSDENSKNESLKQKAAHELKVYFRISLYLAFFLCSVSTYRMLLLSDFHDAFFEYGTALINALVIAKVILIGIYAHVGRRYEGRPLLLSAVYKAFLFGLLVFLFHIVEEAIKMRLHGQSMAVGLHAIRIDDLLGRCLVIFCTFIPLFAFMEVRRVMGEDKFQDLFFHTGSIEELH